MELYLLWHFYFTVVFLSLHHPSSAQGHNHHALVVAGYLPEYRFYIDINRTALLLTDLILFSLQPMGTFVGACCLESHHYQQAREARAYKKQQSLDNSSGRISSSNYLYLWASVGGAGRSEGFASIAADSQKRQKFITHLKNLCEREQLDGIDFDWEQPTSATEFNDYMILLGEAAHQFHSANLMISVATRHMLSPAVMNAVDRIHYMTYDLLFKKREPQHHADYRVVTNFISDIVNKGAPSGKIVMGIPAYARHGQDAQLVKTFAELVDDSEETIQTSDWNGYLYDSPELVQQKVEWAKENKLAGVFFWELGQDKQMDGATGGVLLEAAAAAATSKATEIVGSEEL